MVAMNATALLFLYNPISFARSHIFRAKCILRTKSTSEYFCIVNFIYYYFWQKDYISIKLNLFAESYCVLQTPLRSTSTLCTAPQST